MRILHLSDTHLLASPGLHYGTVDTAAALEATLAAADGVEGIDLVLHSGDVSDDGTPESYRQVRQVDAFARRHGSAVAFLMGNHDRRDTFEAELGPRTGIVETPGGVLVRLDSSVPGQGHGELDADQLRRLDAWLTRCDAGPVVVAVHHPPVPARTALLRELELRRPQDLLEICRRHGVAAILSGHYHHPLVATPGIPVVVAPGVANTTDVTAPPGHERAVHGSGFAVVDVDVDAGVSVVFASVGAGPRQGEVVFDLPPEDVARIASNESRPVGEPPGIRE